LRERRFHVNARTQEEGKKDSVAGRRSGHVRRDAPGNAAGAIPQPRRTPDAVPPDQLHAQEPKPLAVRPSGELSRRLVEEIIDLSLEASRLRRKRR
jgi:hypothetical protein